MENRQELVSELIKDFLGLKTRLLWCYSELVEGGVSVRNSNKAGDLFLISGPPADVAKSENLFFVMHLALAPGEKPYLVDLYSL